VEACKPVAQPDELRECSHGDVQNMNANKDVETRLFKMLAVNEQTASSVRRDHAAYARLSLLTQQAQLVQQQAVQVVNKVASKSEKEKINLCTALVSTEYDDGANKLLTMMNVNHETVALIKKDPPASAKLSLLGEQCEFLQQQAQEAIEDAKLNQYLSQLTAGTVAKLVCGTMYYLYTQNEKEVLSRIAPTEWDNYQDYHGKYLYDYDFSFRRQLEEHEKKQREEKVLLLPHTLAAGKGNSWGGLHVAATPATPANTADDQNVPMDVSESATAADGGDAFATASDSKTAEPICSVHSRW